MEPMGARRAVAIGVVGGLLGLGFGCGAPAIETELAEAKRLYAQGQREEARARFERLQRREPELRAPYLYLAQMALDRGRPDEAIPTLEAGLAKVAQGREAIRFFLGLLYDAADRRLEAAEQYAEALRLDPDFRPAYAKLAAVSFARGEEAAGLELLRRAAARFPEEPAAHADLIEALAKLRRWQEAQSHLRALPAPLQETAPLLYWAGLIALHEGRWDEARSALERVVARESDHWRAWYQLANACDRLGDASARDEALRTFERLYRGALARAEATP